ncbi:MAG TPA: aldolase/citrate lyase family protein, partial [Bacillota bacterium]|nr:aldolase/citrate lyase family protein [Bacillota bacterium]
TFFELGGSTAVECLGLTGLDFLVIDTEHGPFDVESAMDFVRAAELRGIEPFVRIKDHSRSSVLKMLDIGAKGLIVPNVETAEQVKKLVEYGKYYPLGRRGFAPTRCGGFGFDEHTSGSIDEYFEISNDETMIIPQCETGGCLDNIEEIVSVEGVDGVFVGPYDLSIALDMPAQFSDPVFLEAIDRILTACKNAGKYALIFSGSADAAKKYLKDGFDGVAYGLDTNILINAYRDYVKQIKG